MKLTVDRDADALYLNLDEAPAAESVEISPGVILDYNAVGQVVGIEMLHLSLLHHELTDGEGFFLPFLHDGHLVGDSRGVSLLLELK